MLTKVFFSPSTRVAPDSNRPRRNFSDADAWIGGLRHCVAVVFARYDEAYSIDSFPLGLLDRSRHGDLLALRRLLYRRGHRNLGLRCVSTADIAKESPEGDVAGIHESGFHLGLGDQVRRIRS